VFIESRSTVSNDHLSLSFKNWAYEFSNFVTRILVVSICIDDYVSTQHETFHDSMMEGYTEAPISFELDDMMDSEFFCYLKRSIATPIIDHEILNNVDSGDMFGEIVKSERKCFFFIFTGDLDNELDHRERLIELKVFPHLQ
jgi:hypothetical protein